MSQNTSVKLLQSYPIVLKEAHSRIQAAVHGRAAEGPAGVSIIKLAELMVDLLAPTIFKALPLGWRARTRAEGRAGAVRPSRRGRLAAVPRASGGGAGSVR